VHSETTKLWIESITYPGEDQRMSAEKSFEPVAFIGAGVMGLPMIRNLARGGVNVRAWDVRATATAPLAAEGIEIAATLAEAVSGRGIVITMLPDTPQVREVVGALQDVLAAGSLIVDMSTIAAGAVVELAATLQARGIALIDAPVSGGVKGATEATLSIMVGGDPADIARARPILACLGRSIVEAGAVSMGQVFKMCNQLMVASHIQAMCEAFALGRAHGADLARLRETLLGGAAGSWMLQNLGPQVLARADAAGFRIDLMLKDLRLAGEAAFEKGVPLPGLALATALYLEARAHGEGSNGNQALFRTLDRMTNQG
jgi:2-hydroxy-3-oxopropionate reductase